MNVPQLHLTHTFADGIPVAFTADDMRANEARVREQINDAINALPLPKMQCVADLHKLKALRTAASSVALGTTPKG